ncbi:MAG: BamA/TamA family outer membrane protein [Vicinamibacterales bacterium]
MPGTATPPETTGTRSSLDRVLALFAEVRAGEGATAVLMLVNVFLLLVCYSVIKTVREPLILLGGGAEVRSYAAAGQALALVAFVPLYGYVASRVRRMRLLVGVTLFFVACIELFALAVSARVPFVGVAFFIWVGIFNISLVAQFWSFANDIYRKEAGDRLFPVIMIGMTAGAPLGSLVAARLFRAGLTPQVILQLSALLLLVSAVLYVLISRRLDSAAPQAAQPLAASGGFALVLGNPYLRLVALLIMLLNVVNTTGEYVVARLLTAHVADLAAATPGFDQRAFIGAFSGEYQFWVNVSALVLQAFVASRLVKFAGLRGVLLVLPVIALGGYSLIAAGAGFAVVRWIKTAENATDYSIMNTARQLLWLPTSREEKYKAKQAIDTFCVRAGDVVSAGVVYLGTAVLHLGPSQFAIVNVGMTVLWIAVAVMILRPRVERPRLAIPRLARMATATLLLALVAEQAHAQDSRAAVLAGARAEKAAHLRDYEPSPLERRIDFVNRHLMTPRTFQPYIGGIIEGGGLAIGPAVRRPFADTGLVTAHVAWSIRSYGAAVATVRLPEFGNGRVRVTARAEQLHAPGMAFFGVGPASVKADRRTFGLDTTTVGAAVRVTLAGRTAVGGSLEYLDMRTDGADPQARIQVPSLSPSYYRTSTFAELDTRTSPTYSRRGGLLRAEFADFRQADGRGLGFQRIDADAQRFLSLGGDSRVIALRASASTTMTADGEEVPYFMLPTLGGTRALRGYSSWRFRDRNRLLLSGEYRWSAGPLVDMSLFMDAGAVAPRFDDLAGTSLRTSYGVGFTIHTPAATVTRIELARSREGLGLIFGFGPSF